MDAVQSLWTNTKGWFSSSNNNKNQNEISNNTNSDSFDSTTNIKTETVHGNIQKEAEDDDKPIYYKDLQEILEPGNHI